MSNKAYEVEKPNKELKAEPRVPQPNIQNLKTVTPIQIGGQAEVRLPAHRKCQNILFVGDSIAGTIHRPTIETAVNADVNLVKAYSSIYENTHTAAHKAPIFPTRNFEDVITNEMNNSKYDALMIQTGSVDVTNLKTEAPNAKEYLEYFKQKNINICTEYLSSCCQCPIKIS